jgi:hypothetical protein
VLAIPHAFESTGLVLGIVTFAVVAVLCLGTMLILLECQRLVRLRRYHGGVGEVTSYEELAGVVFGRWGYHVVQVIMAVLTLIFCTGFVIVSTFGTIDSPTEACAAPRLIGLESCLWFVQVIANSMSDVFPSVSRELWCLFAMPLLVRRWCYDGLSRAAAVAGLLTLRVCVCVCVCVCVE